MNNGKERFCEGCFSVIAPFDPEAFGMGDQWFHSRNCEEKMLDRSYELYLKRLNREAHKQAIAA
jgi:hypothetical protein